MRNFKLLLTALLLTLVWGFSFSSANSVVYNWNTYISDSEITIANFSCSTYDCHFSYNQGFSSSDNFYVFVDYSCPTYWYSNSQVLFTYYNELSYWRQYSSVPFFYNYSNTYNYWYDISIVCSHNMEQPTNVYALFSKSPISLYVDYEALYNSCQSSLITLSWNYNSLLSDYNQCESSLNQCQSDLSSCTNSCDTLVSQCQSDKETLQLSYSGCIETNSSLQNYNDSLALQLQECIEQWTWFSGATIINLYDMFRSDWINDYSLPITNNIKLPYWYRGFLDDWVLAIKNIYTLENAYSFDDDSFQNWVIENFWKVFLFFMSCGLTLVFLYAIRRYFIWLKSIK